ncbi:pLS20_p028 family conjugation system transmembrane protein [Clostridioides difficile]|uniref:pLS20_p028 family conjugation system transmembrane protein n=1 Tax=Clostridioides difficile TaxID=1496 RepID=UPI00038D7321|nr:hypothetical protein [Clostridioides difficile]EQJ94799.1 hypothetical protein QUA_0954 [Clostridioides difficile P49]MBY1861075.1 hypothetical protein [Clostridioides difficile]MBZ0706802.1 hypothetical protein [Clostridioides difficile]MCH7327245.1 hypothetical protein [Clostridioides difficile]MCI4737396.1 hypothetical protein [Clostridioides difficile]
MGESEMIDILSKYDSIIVIKEFIGGAFRAVGWYLIKFLVMISNSVEGVVDKVYTLNGFFNSPEINELIKMFKPVIFVIFMVSLSYLGFQLMLNRKFKLEGLTTNIALAVVVVVALPTFMLQVAKITDTAISAVSSKYETTANKVIKENLTDIYLFEANNFNKSTKNNIPESAVMNVNVLDELDTSKVKNKDLFSKKIGFDENSKKMLVDLSDGFFGMGGESYYRWHLDYFNVIVTLTCIIVVIVLSSIRIAKIIAEIGIKRIFATLYSFADISTGQGLKTIVKDLFSSFAILFSISLLIKIYLLLSSYASSKVDGIAELIVLIGGASAIISGPDIVERIFGINSGVSTGNVISSIYHGGEMAKGGFSAIRDMTSKVAMGGATVASGMSGFIDGFRTGSNSLNEDDKISKIDKMPSANSDLSLNDKSNRPIDQEERKPKDEKESNKDNSSIKKPDNQEKQDKQIPNKLKDENMRNKLDDDTDSPLGNIRDKIENKGDNKSIDDLNNKNKNDSIDKMPNIDKIPKVENKSDKDNNINRNPVKEPMKKDDINRTSTQGLDRNNNIRTGMNRDGENFSSKSEGVNTPNNNLRNSKDDIVPKVDSPKIADRGNESYVDKIEEKISPLSQKVSQHYQLGKNTGAKFRDSINKKMGSKK